MKPCACTRAGSRLPPALRTEQKSLAGAGHTRGSPKRGSSFGLSAAGQAEAGGHTAVIRRGDHRCVIPNPSPAHAECVRNCNNLRKMTPRGGEGSEGAGAGRRRPAVTLPVPPTLCVATCLSNPPGCPNLLSFSKNCSPVSCFQVYEVHNTSSLEAKHQKSSVHRGSFTRSEWQAAKLI